MSQAANWRWRELLASIAIFETAWFACILAAAHGLMVLGMCAVAISIIWQLTLSSRRRTDLALMAAAFCIGLAWDTFLARSGLVAYASHAPFMSVAPAWILSLWVQLGAVLREPLRWLHTRPAIAAMLGAAGGAASYAAAARLGACRFPDAPLALAVIAAGWSLVFPALLQLARRLDPRRPATSASADARRKDPVP